MNVKDLSIEELKAELKRRTDSETVNDLPDDYKHLVFGTMCTELKKDYVEIFKLVKTEDDMPMMFGLDMRARLNSHRDYRKFYFKVDETTFNNMESSCLLDNEAFAKSLCEIPGVKFERFL
jgi:hypothetical protein